MTIERAPKASETTQINPFLKLTLDIGPLLLFFFANARGVREGDPVRFAGMKVGEVDRLEIRPGSGEGVSVVAATLILPGDLQVPSDSEVRVT